MPIMTTDTFVPQSLQLKWCQMCVMLNPTIRIYWMLNEKKTQSSLDYAFVHWYLGSTRFDSELNYITAGFRVYKNQ